MTRPFKHAPWLVSAALVLLLLGAFAFAESAGWPWLVQPLAQQLQQRLGRAVHLQAQAAPPGARLQFWGGVHLTSPRLEVAAPAWSRAPSFVVAHDIDLRLRYTDLWHAWRGQQLRVRSLKASQLTVYLERTADGRASWQLAQSGVAPASPLLESVDVAAGQLHYQDALLALELDARLSLGDAVAAPAADGAPAPRVLLADARGRFRQDTFTLKLRSTGTLPWEARPGQGSPAAVELKAQVGRANLAFHGVARDLLHLNGLDGSFSVQGPSVAAVGEPLGLTLPTTGPFKASGALLRAGPVWTVHLQTAEVGASRLGGNFVFDTGARVPRLTGQLVGSVLKLVDLVPALGGSTTPASSTTSTPSNANPPRTNQPARPVRPARVLPTRPFDLAALRAMDADVRIAIQHVDANTRLLEPLHPFHARLLLHSGLLSLSEIDARTGQGHLRGTLALNGQGDNAHWVAALNWDGVELAQWIRQTRRAGQPPYASGRLQGHATLRGSGRSTAGILATLQGTIGANVQGGRVSHLLLELGGLDLAESLGVYLQGDQTLTLDCAVADLAVAKGVVTPRVLVLDTSDSTVWVDGALSLATETLDLRAVVAPKDFSPLTLRAPLHIGGTFANPRLELDQQKLGLKLGGAVLLGLLNPLAALLPLLDPGSGAAARENAADCRARMHSKLQRGLTPTPPAAGAAL